MLYRYNPELVHQGKNPLTLDSRAPKKTVEQSMYAEARFKMLTKTKPAEAKRLLQQAQDDVSSRWQIYEYMAPRNTHSADAPVTPV